MLQYLQSIEGFPLPQIGRVKIIFLIKRLISSCHNVFGIIRGAHSITTQKPPQLRERDDRKQIAMNAYSLCIIGNCSSVWTSHKTPSCQR